MKRNILTVVLGTAAAALLTAALSFTAGDSYGLTLGSSPKSAAVALKATDELNLTEGTVVSNVFFNGRSLSGLTPEKAAEVCREPVEKLKEKQFVIQSKIMDEHRYGGTAEDVGISWDDSHVDSELEGLVVEGSLLERYKFAKDIQYLPVEIEVPVRMNESKAVSYFTPLQDAWITEPVSASVSAMSGEVVVTPGQYGLAYDFTEGIAQLVVDVLSDNLGDGDIYYIDPGESVTEPALTTERAATFTIIGSYSTNYVPPEGDEIRLNREQNLVQSTSNMCGHRFAPGEEVSALSMYGSVSEAGGYRPAGTIMNGVHEDQIGGGICQTTTTLYNAVLYAELDVIYRHNHSMIVTYVDPSRDAMVYAAGGSDFKFRNSSSDYIFIESWVNKADYSVHVNIIGHEDHPASHSVEYVSEVLSMTLPVINVVDNPSFPIGFSNHPEEKIELASDDTPLPAVKSRLWKVTVDNGVENRTLINPQDSYNPGTGTYAVSADLTLEFDINPDRNSSYTTITPRYLDGTHLSTNFYECSDAEIIAFNDKMSTLMAAKGLSWPFSYTGFTADSPDCRPGGVPTEPAPTEPSSSSSEGGSDETNPGSDDPGHHDPGQDEPGPGPEEPGPGDPHEDDPVPEG